jgi:hypothetical protein
MCRLVRGDSSSPHPRNFAAGCASEKLKTLLRQHFPIIGRELSKPDQLCEARLGFPLGYGCACPMCCFITPEVEDAAGRYKLLGQPLPLSPGDSISNLLPTVGPAIFGQHLPFVAGHLCNGDGEQNGFSRSPGHHTAGEVICRSMAARRLRCTLCEAVTKPADERLQHLAKSTRVARRMLSRSLYPPAAEFSETETVSLKPPAPGGVISHWSGGAGAKNTDTAKLS